MENQNNTGAEAITGRRLTETERRLLLMTRAAGLCIQCGIGVEVEIFGGVQQNGNIRTFNGATCITANDFHETINEILSLCAAKNVEVGE